jgi:hypothetical protein
MILPAKLDIHCKMAIEDVLSSRIPQTLGTELTRQALVKRGTALVEPGEGNRRAVLAILGLD